MRKNKKTVFILALIGIVGFSTVAFSQSSGYSYSAASILKQVGNIISPLSNNYIFGVDLGTPKNATSSVQSGGALATSTKYYYKVTALDGAGGETLPSTQTSAITAAATNRTIRVSWSAVTGATSYKVYRSATSSVFTTASMLATSTTVTTFDDATTTLSTGKPPTTGTAYATKISSTTPSYFGGRVGIGSSTPAVSLSVTKPNATSSATSSISIGPGYGSSIGKLCMWNGQNYTVMTFAAGSTTPAYATSTACNEN